MKQSSPRFLVIQRGFCRLFAFAVLLTFSPRAVGGTGQLVVNPSSANFGNVQVGSSSSQLLMLTNSGGPKITISQVSLSSKSYVLSGLPYPVTLAGGQSVLCTITFSPVSAGADNQSMLVTVTPQTAGGKGRTNSPSTSVTVALSGTGISLGQFVANPGSISFGTIQLGSSQTITETLTNTGGASVTISAMNTSGAGFGTSGLPLPYTLAVGQNASVNVTFSPASAGSANGNLTISSDAANSTLNVPLSGAGAPPGQLGANPSSLSFGSVATGNSSNLPETLTNVGGSALTISQITASGSGFSFSGINPPVTLAPNQSTTFDVIFAPQAGGSVSGNLLMTSNASNPTLSVSLSGSGVAPGQLTVAPSSINFGNVVVGTTQSQAAQLTASNSPVTVSSVSVSPSAFSVTGITLPTTIAAGNSISFSVVYAPQATGTTSGSVSFASNASNNPTVQAVGGSGTPPPEHSVALAWAASTSTDVAGYNVYRGTASGGPYTQINSALELTTSDTDNAVQAGQTYYYVVTAVDSGGSESSYSNQATAVVPYP